MWASWLKKLVEMPLQCTAHTLPNATQQGSTTTVSAIKFNVLSTCLWRELAWCSASHPNALPLASLLLCECVRGRLGVLSAACYRVFVEMSASLSWKVSPQSFLKSQKIVDVMVPLRWPAFCSTMVTAFIQASFLLPKWGLRYFSHVNPACLSKFGTLRTCQLCTAHCRWLAVAVCYTIMAPPELCFNTTRGTANVCIDFSLKYLQNHWLLEK